jgi:hypothetical protein
VQELINLRKFFSSVEDGSAYNGGLRNEDRLIEVRRLEFITSVNNILY